MSREEIIRIIGKKLAESGLVLIYYEKLSRLVNKTILLAKQNNDMTFQHKLMHIK